MKSVWGAHVRTPEEDELSEKCVCELPRACLYCRRPPQTVEQGLLYAYQGLKDTTEDAEPVEDHLPASIHHRTSNLHSDEDIEDKIKLLDPRVQKLIRTYLEVFGELPPAPSCDKLVQMDLKLKVGRYVISGLGVPPRGSYQEAFAHPPTALLHVPPQSGSTTWGKGAVATSSTLQRVLPREVTHGRPKSHIPLLLADDTSGRVPLHILINLRILGARGREPGQRPCPAGTPTWFGFQ